MYVHVYFPEYSCSSMLAKGVNKHAHKKNQQAATTA